MSQNITDKVINHLVAKYFLIDIFEKSFIDTNVATRVNRGTHYGIRKVKKYLNEIKYKNENYKFTVNGQTGKVVGKYPVDKSKRNLYFLKVLGISGAISAVMAYAACYILR